MKIPARVRPGFPPEVVAVGAIATLAIVHYSYLFISSDSVFVQFVPDDAFYELQLARHFLSTGKWSFDRGISSTTGFHLLNVYLMSCFPRSLIDPWFALRVWSAVGLALSLITAFVICRFVTNIFGVSALIPTFLVFTAPTFINNSLNLLESPYVLLIGALFVLLLSSSPSSDHWFALFVLGILGTLARSDFGGLPAACVLASLITYPCGRNVRRIRRTLVGLAGATVGLTLTVLHNWYFSGTSLSSSVRTKWLWGERFGRSFRPVFLIIRLTVSSAPNRLSTWWATSPHLLAGLALLTVLMVQLSRRSSRSYLFAEVRRLASDTEERQMAFWFVVGAFALVIYVWVYRFDPSIHYWYAANFTIPIILVLATGTRIEWSTGLGRWPIIIVVSSLSIYNIAEAYRPLWPWQRDMRDMALHLSAHPVEGRLASWNAGILGYYLDGRVTNLDGLMNDQIFRYLLEGRSDCYIRDVKIRYVADFPAMLRPDILRWHTGFENKIPTGLKPIYLGSDTTGDAQWKQLTLYRVTDAACKDGGPGT